MKKLLYTFFFGYAALKWRRLIRATIILLLLFITLIGLGAFDKNPPNMAIVYARDYPDMMEIETMNFLIFTILLLTPIVSWVIKPFIVKEN
jgi:hypothetical protein